MSLTPSQQVAYEVLKSKSSVFLTGGAGTGKSYLIREFLKDQPSKKTPVLASTGAAAILLGGRTFHSFFGLGIMQGGPQAAFQKAVQNKRLRKRLKDADTLVVDEVSMLSGEAFDCAERIARALRGGDEPWGGIRVIAVGDFAQLPPVSRMSLQKDWAFLSGAWKLSQFRHIELKDFVRTEEEDFLKILGDLRRGELTDELEEFLESRVIEEGDPDIPHLFSRRDVTEKFNRGRLAELGSDLKVIETKYFGESRGIEALKRDAPVAAELELKEGAFVMIRVNDPKQRFVNGTTGFVRRIRDDVLEVDTETRRLELEPFAFSYMDADGKEIASALNFPVTLAYGSTIHKIQGATLHRAHVDLGSIWEPGQAYVALSRVRRAKDITLSRWSPGAVKADPQVQHFYSRFHQTPALRTAQL